MLYLVNPLVSHTANTPGFEVNRQRTYTITSVVSGLVLSADADHNIVQKKWTGSDSQKWKFIPLSGGNFTIQCVANGQFLHVPQSSQDNRTQLITWWDDGLTSQWKLIEEHSGVYWIRSAFNNKVADVLGGDTDEGNKIVQYRKTDNTRSQQWILSEVLDPSRIYDRKATVYTEENYGGDAQILGPGKYDMGDLEIGNDTISSLKVPEGLRVTLFEHGSFRGRHNMFTGDIPSLVAEGFNDITSAILVEKVATVFEHGSYQGRSLALGVGRYKMDEIASIGNDRISSIKVPYGLQVYLFQDDTYHGYYKIFEENAPNLSDYNLNDKVSSIIIKAKGSVVPKNAINFGDEISLKSHHGKWMSAQAGETLEQVDVDQSHEKFKIWRAGDTKHDRVMSYGDIIALQGVHGKYISVVGSDGFTKVDGPAINDWELFRIFRVGDSESEDFVAQDDTILLKSLRNNKFLCAQPADEDYIVSADGTKVDGQFEKWTIDSWINNYSVGENGDDSGFGTSVCGAEACLNDSCGAAACGSAAGAISFCGADVCGTAACVVASSLISVCGGAVSGIAICSADFSFLSVGGVGVNGLGTCGADACGAAACGAAACGAAACGAAACGADACGAAGCGIDGGAAGACSFDFGGIDTCQLEACAVNVCAIDICPIDACAADACAIDIIPIVPGI